MNKKATLESSPRRLDFLRNFLVLNQITWAELACELSITKMAITSWFVNDDIPYSQLSRIFRTLGYTFSIKLTREPYAEEPPLQFLGPMARSFEKGQLPFLCVAMAKYHITKAELARKLGIYVTTVGHMFRANQIRLSRIFDIARLFDLSIVITITPEMGRPMPLTTNMVTITTNPLVNDNAISEFLQ